MKHTRRVFAVFSAAAAIVLLIGSWTPFQFASASFAEVWDSFSQVLPLPRFSRSDVVVNYWLGFPIALGMCGWLAAHQGSVGRRWLTAVTVVGVQALLSLAAELGQGWLPARTSSIFDFGLQVAGAISAVALWQYAGNWVFRLAKSVLGGEGESPATRWDAAITLLAAAILIWSVMPLDIVTSPLELAHKYRSQGIELVPFTRWEPSLWENIYQWLASAVLGLPLGLAWGRWVSKCRGGQCTIYTLVLGAIGIGMLPELLQIPIRSRVASATDAVFLMVGSIAGALCAVEISEGRLDAVIPSWQQTWRSPGFWLGLLCLQALVICLMAWLPLGFSSDPALLRERWQTFIASPMQSPAGSDVYNALTLFRSGMMGAVLGGLAAMFLKCLSRQWSPSERIVDHIAGAVVIVVLAMFVAVVELGQLLEPSRTCSMLSASVQQAGVVVGYGVVWNSTVHVSAGR